MKSPETIHLEAASDDTPEARRELVARAAGILAEGGLVAVPTETVYGLAVRGDLPESIDRLYAVKDRPRDRSMTIHLPRADAELLDLFVPSLPPVARRLSHRFWPGPLTLVVPDLTGKLVGLRVPDHALLREVLEAAPPGIVIPSANPSGEPAATSAAEVSELYEGKIDAILSSDLDVEGGGHGGLSSTVVLVRDDAWEVLREGAISRESIERAGLVHVIMCCTGNTCRSPMAAAILEARLRERLDTQDFHALGLTVRSVGLAASEGAPASSGAVAAMKKRGISLAEHSSAQLESRHLDDTTVVYVMTAAHRAAILDWRPGAPVAILDREDRDIADPIGGGEQTYERAADQIARAIEDRLDQVLAFAELGSL